MRRLVGTCGRRYPAVLLLGLLAMTPGAATNSGPVRGYRADVPSESPAARADRHRRVAERRAGTIILCHRGASAFAPENTLEACAAAMDYGADGCEIDLRRTADGVLVLFHDDMLDRLTEGFGTVNQATYYDLLRLEPRCVYGTATRTTRLPTFAAFLVLARQRTMLLHLDIKEPGLEEEIALLLTEADVWDHVVAVNTYNSDQLRQDPRLRLLPFKGPGLFGDRLDVDPEPVRAQLARPGQMIIVDDPRVSARELGRPRYQPVPLPDGLRADWPPPPRNPGPVSSPARSPGSAALSPGIGIPAGQLGPLDLAEALRILDEDRHLSVEQRSVPVGASAEVEQRTPRILMRARAAQALGNVHQKAARIVRALEHEVRQRSMHRDWMYHGLDGAIAARALGMLGATESAPVLIEAFLRVDPDLRTVANPEFGQYPLSWTDFRLKMHLLPAIAELRCPASRKFLEEYLAMGEASAREIAPPMFEEATWALMRYRLTRADVEALLRNPRPAVRGTAVLECLDRPNKVRRAALQTAAPWALTLPGAKR